MASKQNLKDVLERIKVTKTRKVDENDWPAFWEAAGGKNHFQVGFEVPADFTLLVQESKNGKGVFEEVPQIGYQMWYTATMPIKFFLQLFYLDKGEKVFKLDAAGLKFTDLLPLVTEMFITEGHKTVDVSKVASSLLGILQKVGLGVKGGFEFRLSSKQPPTAFAEGYTGPGLNSKTTEWKKWFPQSRLTITDSVEKWAKNHPTIHTFYAGIQVIDLGIGVFLSFAFNDTPLNINGVTGYITTVHVVPPTSQEGHKKKSSWDIFKQAKD